MSRTMLSALTAPFSLLILVSNACADSITINGVKHENVVVRESDSRYYVQFPADGTTINVMKTDVESVQIEKGPQREALHEQWLERNQYSNAGSHSTPAGRQRVRHGRIRRPD